MKRVITIALALSLAAAAYAAGRTAGRQEGINHAIEDSEIWTVECYDPNDPYANETPDGYDQTIYIEIDGEVYEHGMYQC